MTIVEMCVHMCCAGCESRVRKSLAKLEGIDGVDVDMAMQKVTVTGHVEQRKVLKAVRKTGRRAVLWPYPYHPDQPTAASAAFYPGQHPAHQPAGAAAAFTANPFAYSTASTSSYNYRKHGTDESIVHGYGYHLPASSGGGFGERAGDMFSDENTSACSIM